MDGILEVDTTNRIISSSTTLVLLEVSECNEDENTNTNMSTSNEYYEVPLMSIVFEGEDEMMSV